MERGLCNINMDDVSSNEATWNPYSWNNQANTFFLDQPYVTQPPPLLYRRSSTIFSVGIAPRADHDKVVETTEGAAKNTRALITSFFEILTQFSGRLFHLAGESYAVG